MPSDKRPSTLYGALGFRQLGEGVWVGATVSVSPGATRGPATDGAGRREC